MTTEAVAVADRPSGTTRTSVLLWVCMLAIVAIEVAITYARPSMSMLIVSLLLLAAAQATIGLLYFMHLRHERRVLGWTLVPALLFALLLMNQLWPDALRVFRLRIHN